MFLCRYARDQLKNNFQDVLHDENLVHSSGNRNDSADFTNSFKNLDKSKVSKKLLDMCDQQVISSFSQ